MVRGRLEWDCLEGDLSKVTKLYYKDCYTIMEEEFIMASSVVWRANLAVFTLLIFLSMPVNCAMMNPVSDAEPFTLSSPMFKNNAYVSSGLGLGCRGQGKSPALTWVNPPAGTKTFAIIFQDLDVSWLHWDISNIPASYTGLPENIPSVKVWNDGIKQGANSFRSIGYGGPCPPNGTHRYEFEIRALDENNKVLKKAKLVISSDGQYCFLQ